jgi:hypothetical protein
MATLAAVILAGCGSNTTTPPAPPVGSNSLPVSVNFAQGTETVDILYASVTVCVPGSTTECQTIENVRVDTGSIGLRVLSSAFTKFPASALGAVQAGGGEQLQECVQYGDSSYTWGNMAYADVSLAGEKAPSVPIQIIGGNNFLVPGQCLGSPIIPGLPNGGNYATVSSLRGNGILGISNQPTDCASFCTDQTDLSELGYPYYVCPANQDCTPVTTSVQATNPVSAFSSADNNGVLIAMDPVPAGGALSASGTIYFGIGTQSNNALGSATLYALDPYRNMPTLTYNGSTYTSNAFFDTGSNGLFILDGPTLGIGGCTVASSLYCPASTLTFSNIGLNGWNGVGLGSTSISIANANALFSNAGFAAFNDLAGDSGDSLATDFWDFGMPFFLGRNVFVGIEGQTVPGGADAPFGFVAF